MILAGTLLASTPKNRVFKNKLVLLFNVNPFYHGLIVNQPSDTDINYIFDKIGKPLDPLVPDLLYKGGNIDMSSIFLVHTSEWRCNSTFDLNSKLALTSDKEMVDEFENNNFPNKWKFIAGKCVWTINQLHAELNDNLWYVVPQKSSVPLIFLSGKRSWKKAIEKCSSAIVNEWL